MYRIILLGALKLHGIKSHESSQFPRSAHAEGGTSPPIAGITGDENFVFAQILMVNGHQALTTDHEGLDGIKSCLMVCGPCRKITSGFFCCERSENTGVICQFGEKP